MTGREIYLRMRRKLIAAGLWPEGRMARIACYLLSLAAVLFALKQLLGLFAAAFAEHLGGWVSFLTFTSTVLFAVLAFRWLKRKILWRLRNRLIVTYVFIGVIPVVLLVAMAFITLYGAAGQFAVFVLTSEINSQLDKLQAVNTTVANELAGRIESGGNPTSDSLIGLKKREQSWKRRRACAWYGDQPLSLCGDSKDTGLIVPAFAKEGFHSIAREQDALYLRVATSLPLGSKNLTVITSEPLDQKFVENLAADLGEVTLSTVGIPLEKAGGENESSNSVQAGHKGMRPTFTAGTVPPAASGLDREITFFAPLAIVDWKTGKRDPAGAFFQVMTRPSVLYNRLFAALGEFVRGVEGILLGIGIFFAIIELIALFTGTRMTRTVTGAVAQLYDATRHVDGGDFSHRIPVTSTDQLAQLALSFNSMTESIEKLIKEQKEKQRLENELAIAQEVQDQLFPRQVSGLESLEVHGFCRPARTVSGDYYDFVTANGNRLMLAVGDISGKGISAALLMATIHSAVRAYSMESMPQVREPVAVGAAGGSGRLTATWPDGAEVSPSGLLALLNHQLYESTPPEKYATLFLGIYDGGSRRLTYSNGGHLPPILIGGDGALRRLERGGTVIGLFDNMTYEEGLVEMRPGEIFIAYSDGVTEPENDFGEFGEERLIDLVRENRHFPLAQISQIVTMAVDDWIGDNEQPDDVTLVLARAR